MHTKRFFEFLFLAALAQSAIITVSDPAVGIKLAVQSARSGDVVRVLGGTYSGAKNCDLFVSENITLEAPDGPRQTRIDCEGRSRCLTVGAGVRATISGFSFVRGAAPSTAATTGNTARAAEVSLSFDFLKIVF